MNIHLIHHHHPHRHSLHCLHSSTSNPIPLTITLSFTLNFFASHYLHHSLHTPISLTSYQLHFLRSLLTFFSLFLFFLLCDFGSASNEEAKVSLPIRFSPSILWLNWFFEKIEIVFRIWRVNPSFIFTLSHPIIFLSSSSRNSWQPTVARDDRNSLGDWVRLMWVSFPLFFSLLTDSSEMLGKGLV